MGERSSTWEPTTAASTEPKTTCSLVARPPIHTASFAKWNPNRRDEIFLYVSDAKSSDESLSFQDNYRYKLTVIDRPWTIAPDDSTKKSVSSSSSSSLTYATAVFLIPAGRESEFMFQSTAGLRSIQRSAATARLIAVTFGRPPTHTFPNQAIVQAELSFVVKVLAAPPALLLSTLALVTVHSETIPFMALDGIGDRNVLVRGESEISGRYLVEQCVVTSGANMSNSSPSQRVRRLYFLDGNPFVIQSEVALLPDSNENNEESNAIASERKVDKSITAFRYHQCVTAGILALLPEEDPTRSSGGTNILLIGLGGGGLVNLWHYIQSPTQDGVTTPLWTISAIELDETMVEIASRYFAVDCDRLQVRIGDGLLVHCIDDTDVSNHPDDNDVVTPVVSTEAVDALGFEPASLDYIVIDVDSKDTGTGMSCPPVGFVQVDYLQRLSSLLRHDRGVLAINVSARDPDMFQSTCRTVQSVFSNVFLSRRGHKNDVTNDDDDYGASSDDEEDLNVVVFATHRMSMPPCLDMVHCVKRRMQAMQMEGGWDEILFSDLSSCLEDFTTLEQCGSFHSTLDTPEYKGKKKSGNGKRRNPKIGGNHKRR